jgi:outer membrane protein assembly factor BamB
MLWIHVVLVAVAVQARVEANKASCAWSTTGHDAQRTGRSPCNGPSSRNPTIAWSRDVSGSSYAVGTVEPPMVAENGDLYLLDLDGVTIEVLHPGKGTLKWKSVLQNCDTLVGTSPSSQPLLVNNTLVGCMVLFGCMNSLMAVDCADGSELWQSTLSLHVSVCRILLSSLFSPLRVLS